MNHPTHRQIAPNAKIAVALSGGVDSAVTAYLLKKQGYDIAALFMKNWDDNDPNCPARADYQDVVRVASTLDIPFYTLNFEEAYLDHVFAHFLSGLKKGVTPNPDILCNREIKFKALFDKTKSLGFDYLATGHYAQTDDMGHLWKGFDTTKDQSYFLAALRQDVLKKVLFPIGHLPKKTVREIAKEAGLANHAKPDSTGICFIGNGKFRSFIQKHISMEKGHFIDENGTIIGEHEGLHLYTIGQRKGISKGGPGDPWFVAEKDPLRNTVTIVQGTDHPLLHGEALSCFDIHWVCSPPSSFPYHCSAKIRYRTEVASCTLVEKQGLWHVYFDLPQRAITPGQTIVFYQNDLCLGCATILSRLPGKPASI